MTKEYFLVLEVKVPYPGLVVELERIDVGLRGRRKLVFTPNTTLEQIKYGLVKEEERINLRIDRLVRNELTTPIDITDYQTLYNPTDGWQMCANLAKLLRQEMVIRRKLNEESIPLLIEVLTERISHEVRQREFEVDFSLALVQACMYRRWDLANFFIKQGANVNSLNVVDNYLITPLKSCLKEESKSINLTKSTVNLTKSMVNLTLKEEDSNKFCSSAQMIELLLDHGAELTEDFIELAVEKDLPLWVLSRIVGQNKLPSLPHIAANTAISTGSFSTLNWLLDSGLEPLSLERYGSSPIVRAIYAGKYGIATALISSGFQFLDHEEGLEELLD